MGDCMEPPSLPSKSRSGHSFAKQAVSVPPSILDVSWQYLTLPDHRSLSVISTTLPDIMFVLIDPWRSRAQDWARTAAVGSKALWLIVLWLYHGTSES